MSRNEIPVFPLVHTTEMAALAARMMYGRGDKKKADGYAVAAMRKAFDRVPINSEVVIGEGYFDQAPHLYVGEKLGLHSAENKEPEYAIGVDPLECTTNVAMGFPNAMVVLGVAPYGSLMSGPDIYMNKISVGPKAHGVIDLRESPTWNLQKIARALGKKIDNLSVQVLKRPRHDDLVAEIRQAGARVVFITDGDIAGGIAPCIPGYGIDCLMGVGKSAEAVLAAIAIKQMGGDIQIQWAPRNTAEMETVLGAGLSYQKVYGINDLTKEDPSVFIATGVCTGPLVFGVREHNNGVLETETLILSSLHGQQTIQTLHKSSVLQTLELQVRKAS